MTKRHLIAYDLIIQIVKVFVNTKSRENGDEKIDEFCVRFNKLADFTRFS